MYVSRIFGHVSRHEIHKALQFKDPLPRTPVKMYLLVSKSGDMHTSFEGFLWTPWLTIFHQCRTDLKKQVPIAAFTIRKETQIMGLSCNLVQRFDGFFEKPSIFLPTI